MKLLQNKFAAVLVLVFIFFGQISSTATSLDKEAAKRIATLTKVWGLMKYYHSNVANGTINWDSVFVAYVPKVVAARGQKEYHSVVDDLYAQIPAPKLAISYNLPKADTIVEIFSEKEIAAYKISSKLKQQLIDLYERHLPLESKYITNKYKEYTLDHVRFLENPMAEVVYPSKETRLLALARYWNTINYFYPHKQTIGKDWSIVLEKYIPVFNEAQDEQAYHLAIQRLNRELKDSHSFASSPVLNAMWGPNPYFQVKHVQGKFVITKILVDSLARVQDIQVGDAIIAINGKPVQQRVKELKPLLRGSNEVATYRDIAAYLLNVDTSTAATIKIKRGKSHLTRSISRLPYQELMKRANKRDEKLWKELERNIVYVDYTKIQNPDTLPALFAAVKDAQTVILDLRGYPNFNVYRQTLPALYEKDFHSSYTSNALVHYPGFFSVSKSMYEHTDTSALIPYKGNMIVLVDESTQSLPESFALGLTQRSNTTIMGSQTAGTTGNITWLPLPGGANVAFTGVGEHGVNGSFEQRKGVKVDKVVKPTVASIASGKDAVLDTAVKEARKE
ncbi:S41 family peptidase [Pontibacter locisalis]|uniref:S41 family peptidase n=1 Tax=Pontibacter locisalis TaxID=1719035 RepID=A0ABW5II97_9BACT